METTLSREAEEYIEIIYRLQKRQGVAKTSDLAKNLRVVPGSITNTIQHLESHGLVVHEPYRGVKLTSAGEKVALNILRRHRLAERLLTDILNAEWTAVHEDACLLEHAMTKNFAALLEKRLGNPTCCPHGNPIPSETGILKEEETVMLTEIELNKTCQVARITDEQAENLSILARAGIKPDATICLLEKSSSKVVVRVNKKEVTLTYALAENVRIKTSPEVL
ncbi:MAG: metal-dependent transcriptional regulator [Candidatus Bathyarchaeota archaeon]|nr:metal-dependent transcriptional regulator [Candidatus Bathyarchaeota archaeon]